MRTVNKLLQEFLLFGLTFLISNCSKNSDLVTIRIQTKNLKIDAVSYYLSEKGFFEAPMIKAKRVGLNADNQVIIKTENRELNALWITSRSNTFIKQALLYLKPGDKYIIIFDSLASTRIEGKYSKGQQLLTDFFESFPSLFMTNKEYFGKLKSDTIPESLINTVEDQKRKTIDGLDEILRNKEIDDPRYYLIKNEIDYSYINTLLAIIYDRAQLKSEKKEPNYGNVVSYPINLKSKKYQLMLESIFKSYPHNKDQIKLCSKYSDYLFYYLWYNSLNDTINLFADRTDELNFAKKYLDPELYEFYFANQFKSFSLKEPFEAVEFRFNSFKTQFPSSRYLTVLEDILPRMKQYFESVYPSNVNSNRESLPGNIILVRDYQKINSLNEILQEFKGKVVFIDFWASWCMPCRGEFEFAVKLNEFAKKNNVVLLYISTDKDENNWIKTLKSLNLTGYHARMVTDEFRSELKRYQVTGIPRYMIVDKSGKIVEPDALRPSTQDELFNQIRKYNN
ncbi:MAG TPA: TlpA disulfide reductase family protein [Ignavibacteria bacterium]